MPRFERGNRFGKGRPKGAISTDRKRFALEMRRLLAEEGIETLRSILRGRNRIAAMRALEFCAHYGIGKPTDRVMLGMDPDSAEAWLLRIAGQPVPGEQFDDDAILEAAELPALTGGENES